MHKCKLTSILLLVCTITFVAIPAAPLGCGNDVPYRYVAINSKYRLLVYPGEFVAIVDSANTHIVPNGNEVNTAIGYKPGITRFAMCKQFVVGCAEIERPENQFWFVLDLQVDKISIFESEVSAENYITSIYGLPWPVLQDPHLLVK